MSALVPYVCLGTPCLPWYPMSALVPPCLPSASFTPTTQAIYRDIRKHDSIFIRVHPRSSASNITTVPKILHLLKVT